MIPGNKLSTDAHPALFLGQRATPTDSALLEYDTAAVPVSTLVYELEDWTGTCTDGENIVLSSPDESDIIAVTDTDITELSFAFDQNHRPIVAYVAGGSAKLRWYDLTVPGWVTTDYGATYLSPRVSLDDKHRLALGTSDVIFAYIRANKLRWRIQRDRYLTEYPTVPGADLDPGLRLRRIGMNVDNRFQFEFHRVA